MVRAKFAIPVTVGTPSMLLFAVVCFVMKRSPVGERNQ